MGFLRDIIYITGHFNGAITMGIRNLSLLVLLYLVLFLAGSFTNLVGSIELFLAGEEPIFGHFLLVVGSFLLFVGVLFQAVHHLTSKGT